MQKNNSMLRTILILIGAGLVCFAAIVSNQSIERALLGNGAKSLDWGTTLFRSLLAFHGILIVGVGIFWKKFTKQTNDSNSNFSQDSEETNTTRTTWLVLILLSVVALILRLWNLNSDLWVDEVFTLLDFVRLPVGQILTSFPNQNQHMFFSLLSHASMSIFGESAWAMRLPSVLFGVASIWALFFLGRRLFGTRESLLACVLMTVSYHHIWFSQNARGYMGLLFFTLLATWIWLEALSKNSWGWWFGYVAAVSLGMWIHMTMAFVIAAHGLLHLSFLLFPSLGKRQNIFSLERNAGWRPFAAWVLCVSVTLQLFALALPEFLRVGLHEESVESEWTNPFWVITESLRGIQSGFAVAGLLIVLCGSLVLLVGWLSLLKRNVRAGVLMVMPAVLAGSTMLALGHNLWPRFFFFSMGFALLIAVHGAVKLPQLILKYIPSLPLNEKLSATAGLALAVVMIITSALTVPRNYTLPKQNFSGAKVYVESNRKPGDAVVAVGIAAVIYGRYLAPEWSVAETNVELNEVLNHTNIWLVYTLPIEVKAYRPDIWRTIEKDFAVVKVFPGTLNGGEVYVCRQRNVKEIVDESRRSSDSRTKNNSVSQKTTEWK